MTTIDLHRTHSHRSPYGLSCKQFDALLARAAGACDICRTPWGREPNNSPCIDHDHTAGERAVRGLVCRSCNQLIRRVDAGERPVEGAFARYLDNAWYLTAEVRRPTGQYGRPKRYSKELAAFKLRSEARAYEQWLESHLTSNTIS